MTCPIPQFSITRLPLPLIATKRGCPLKSTKKRIRVIPHLVHLYIWGTCTVVPVVVSVRDRPSSPIVGLVVVWVCDYSLFLVVVFSSCGNGVSIIVSAYDVVVCSVLCSSGSSGVS